ncbi:MAG: hypothetical protein IPM60_01595 [Rhodospirillales bacterium]|nr:hypothetical protein [Rhodospirillales bacterium]
MPHTSRHYDIYPRSPEHALWLAVLDQVIRDAFDVAGGPARDDARRWLTEGSSDLHLVCGFVGIDARRLSQHMRDLAERDEWFGEAEDQAAA